MSGVEIVICTSFLVGVKPNCFRGGNNTTLIFGLLYPYQLELDGYINENQAAIFPIKINDAFN